MPFAPKFPSIPVPTAEVNGLHRTALALKQCVEMLTGLDAKSMTGGSSDRFAPHVFYQPDEPEALHTGDFWLASIPNSYYSLSIWNGVDWLVIAVLPSGGGTGPTGIFQSASGFMSEGPAAITMTQFVLAQIGWGGSKWNVNDCFDTYTFRPKEAGYWEIEFQLGLSWPTAATPALYPGQQEVHIYLNGTSVALAANNHAIFFGPMNVTSLVRWAGNLVVGDEVSFWAVAGNEDMEIVLDDRYTYAYAYKYANAPAPVSAATMARAIRKYFPKPFVGHKVRSV